MKDNSNLLRDAIIDAKLIRKTAMENARQSLQESFSPNLQSMLEKKLNAESASEEPGKLTSGDKWGTADENPENPSGANNRMKVPTVKEGGEGYHQTVDGVDTTAPNLAEDDEEMDMGDDENFGGEEEVPGDEVELDVDAQGADVDVVPVGGGNVHMDPNSAAVDGEEESDFDMGGEESPEGQTDDEMELESIIRELESEVGSEEDIQEPQIGSEDGNHVDISVAKKPEDVDVNFSDMEDLESPEGSELGDDEDIDISEILRELEEEEEECSMMETLTTDQPLKANTEQPQKGNFGSDKSGTGKTPSFGGKESHDMNADSDSKYGKANGSAGDNFGSDKTGMDKTSKGISENKALKKRVLDCENVITFLRARINEINLLNAKLLYTNKIFSNFPLNNEQKMKVVESFDYTRNVREVKLIYATLAESFNFDIKKSSVKKPTLSSTKRSTITEGLASRMVKSTKPSEESTKILNEGSDMANRFQKLAGINVKKK